VHSNNEGTIIATAFFLTTIGLMNSMTMLVQLVDKYSKPA